jgi:hypothetical protein
MARNVQTRPLIAWGTGPLPNARVVLQLTASAPEAGKPGGRASVRVDRVPWRGVAEEATTIPGMAGPVRLPRLAG